MATPAASPQVSSTVGLKNVVIAPLVTDTDAEHTYGDLQLLAGAIEASITPENADPDIQYADDVEFDTLYPDPELSFKTKMADIPLQSLPLRRCLSRCPLPMHRAVRAADG